MTRATADSLPFASVIVPVRDGERTIGDCIESLLATDYPAERRELLVVDNGSSDRTPEIVRGHPVRYLHEPRRGVSHARNRGIEASRGEILAFIDGDCVAEPNWLSAIVSAFADPEVGCVAGGLGHVEPRTAAERQAARMLGEWQRFAVSSNPPYAITANAAYRRGVLNEIGRFDTGMTRAQDVELGLRFHRHSDLRLAYSADALVRHRHRPTQLGFLRQQAGWAYGAGLVGARHAAVLGRPRPPRAAEVGNSLRGLWLVLRARLRGEARREWLEDAWFGLLRQLAWFTGAWAGLLRGRWIARARS